ncbi:hypothetical protein RRF57_007549 [Xylaria bambusicola]|uniref:DUF7918 domain-containing protein n=1 Tax=Xylaria bambusicola TaxID=326684 RepID=A0AAN7YZW8_9PEZI
MAIIGEVPGIKVTVQVNGEDATEHIDPHASKSDVDDDPECPVISRYIESIDDAEFSITLAVDDDTYGWRDVYHDSVVAIVNVDGQVIVRPIIKPRRGVWVVAGVDIYSEESNQWYRKPLKFSAITIVEDQSAKEFKKGMKAAQSAGLIQIAFERHVSGKKLTPLQKSFNSIDTLEVAEKALKNNFISHSISYVVPSIWIFTLINTGPRSFGERKVIQKPNMWACKRVSTDQGPIAIFRFMYKSRELLEEELIIPRSSDSSSEFTPEPTGSGISLSVGDLPMAEVLRLAQERLDQMKGAEEEKPKYRPIKREADEVIDVDEEARGARALKRCAVTVDLTDD